MTQPEFSEVYDQIIREVPERPSAEDLYYFRYRAVDALEMAIRGLAPNPNSRMLLLDAYNLLDACNYISDYTMARIRWLEIYGPNRNRHDT